MSALPGPFQYEPLNPSREEIRLIRFEEANGDDQSLLRLQLRNVSVLDMEEYTALSYCWGDRHETRSVILNGIEGSIGLNLHSALTQLRSMRITQVWVDAICINQRDNVEKAMQIPRMRLVYQSAVQTAAWLGEPPSHIKSGLAGLNTEDFSQPLQRWTQPELHASLLHWLGSNAYWHRVWIVQELAFSTDIILVCGTVYMRWSILTSLLLNEETKGRSYQDRQVAPGFPSAVHGRPKLDEVVTLFTTCRENVLRGNPMPLLELLLKTRQLQSSEPLDKLYGLLGLASDSSLLVPVPSYNTDLWRVRVDLTTRLVAKEQCLDPLFVFSPGQGKDITSWLPNWLAFDPVEIGYMHMVWSRMIEEAPSLIVTNRTCASIFRPVHVTRGTVPEFRIEGTALVAHGSVIDSIDIFLKPSPDTSAFGAMDISPLNPSSGLKQNSRTPYPEVKHAAAAVRAALDMNRRYMQDAGKREYWTDYLFSQTLRGTGTEFQHVRTWLDESSAFPIGSSTLKATLQQGSLRRHLHTWMGGRLDERSELPRAPAQTIAAMMKHPDQIMITKEGFIGWCCPEARVGDRICVLKGCKLPLVIRSVKGESFEVVGTAWLHGMMHGPEPINNVRCACWDRIGWPPNWKPLQFV